MTFRQVVRDRMAFVLLFVIPSAFFALIALTTKQGRLAFKLASISEDTVVEVAKRSEMLVFIGVACVGILASYVALNLVQRHAEVDRRLLLCGYRHSQLLASKLLVLWAVLLMIAAYVSLIVLIFFRPAHPFELFVAFALQGYVYGCYGLLVGVVFRRELEGILFIVLLANIDASWLQNPVYYTDAQNTAIIRYLPAYFPSQASMVAAFTDHGIAAPALNALAYGTALLSVAFALHWWKARVSGHSTMEAERRTH